MEALHWSIPTQSVEEEATMREWVPLSICETCVYTEFHGLCYTGCIVWTVSECPLGSKGHVVTVTVMGYVTVINTKHNYCITLGMWIVYRVQRFAAICFQMFLCCVMCAVYLNNVYDHASRYSFLCRNSTPRSGSGDAISRTHSRYVSYSCLFLSASINITFLNIFIDEKRCIRLGFESCS